MAEDRGLTITYTLQALSADGDHWYDVHIRPHHPTLDEVRTRRMSGQERNPDSTYRVLKVTREVIE